VKKDAELVTAIQYECMSTREWSLLSYRRLCLPAARTISSVTRTAPEMTTPRPNPGKMYALFAWYI
jgi:hypothetical protein